MLSLDLVVAFSSSAVIVFITSLVLFTLGYYVATARRKQQKTAPKNSLLPAKEMKEFETAKLSVGLEKLLTEKDVEMKFVSNDVLNNEKVPLKKVDNL